MIKNNACCKSPAFMTNKNNHFNPNCLYSANLQYRSYNIKEHLVGHVFRITNRNRIPFSSVALHKKEEVQRMNFLFL